MRSHLLTLFAAFALVSSGGCGVFRCIEQWKCDTLGMCHGGTTPTMPYAGPPPLPGCGPCADGCNSQPPMFGPPAPM